MKIFLRVLAMVVVAGLLAGGWYFYSQYKTAQASQSALSSINLASLDKGELVVTIGATGKVRPQQTATLTWGTSGQVENVKVKAGDMVKAGQVLATLSQTSLPQAVILAQSTLVTDQQALADLAATATQKRVAALADITTYEVSVRDAQYNLDNFTVPSNQANLSTTDALASAKKALDAARTAFEPYRNASEANTTRKALLVVMNEAQADYNSAVKRLQLEYNLQVAQANLDQAWSTFNQYKDGPDAKDVAAAQAKIASDQATLEAVSVKAPFDGIVTSVSAQAGDQVSNGTAAFRIDNLTGLYVDLSVSEVDIYQVQVGQPVTVTFDALANKIYTGEVTGVSPVSDASSTTVNFTVNVHVLDADAAVRPGMTSEVKIVVSQKKDVLLVPLQAVTTLNGSQVVYVYQPASSLPAGSPAAGAPVGYSPVKVTLGTSSDAYAELATGSLKAGDQIVLNPDSLASAIKTASSSRSGMGILGILGGGGGPGAGGPPPDAGGNPPAGTSNSGSSSSGSSTQK